MLCVRGSHAAEELQEESESCVKGKDGSKNEYCTYITSLHQLLFPLD